MLLTATCTHLLLKSKPPEAKQTPEQEEQAIKETLGLTRALKALRRLSTSEVVSLPAPGTVVRGFPFRSFSSSSCISFPLLTSFLA